MPTDSSKDEAHLKNITQQVGTGLLCLFFHLLCYAAVLKTLTYYAQFYAHFHCADLFIH